MLLEENPTVNKVKDNFNDIPTAGSKVTYTGGPLDNVILDFGHLQGQAYYRNVHNQDLSNDTLAIFSANHYTAIKTNNGRLNFFNLYTRKFVSGLDLPNEYGTHAGGIQMIGDYLCVPVESQSGPHTSAIFIYDMSTFAVAKSPTIMPGRITSDTRKVGAVGIAQLGDHHVVAAYDNGAITFFQSNGSPLNSSSLAFNEINTLSFTEEGASGFSSVGLVVESGTNDLYLVGLMSNESDWSDWGYLYNVNIDESTGQYSVALVKKIHYDTQKGGLIGPLGVHFRFAAGIYLDPNNGINLLASDRNSNAGVIATNLFDPGTGVVQAVAKYSLAQDQGSRVSQNFAMTDKNGYVVWSFSGLKEGVNPFAIQFAINRDISPGKDKNEYENLTQGSVTPGSIGGGSHKLYICRLTYSPSDDPDAPYEKEDAIKQIAANPDGALDDDQLIFFVNSTSLGDDYVPGKSEVMSNE